MTIADNPSVKTKLCSLFCFIRTSIFAIVWLITILGFHHLYDWPKALSILIFLALPLIGHYFRSKKLIVICILIGFLAMLISVSRVTPSNNRDWSTEMSVLPKIKISGNQAIIQGIRNFRWHNQEEFDPLWEDRTFDLQKLNSLDFIVEPFQGSELMAHTMIRFGFEDGKKLVVSVEARREKHEKFSLVAGSFRQFELIYIFGTEQDLLGLRAIHRGTRLYVYPIKADQEFILRLFKDLASAANNLHLKPRFYRSIRDNCTTTLVKHFDRQHADRIGLRYETVFPVLTGRLLYKRGYMDTNLPYEEARDHFRVDEVMREKHQK